MILMAADYVGFRVTEFLCEQGESIKVFVYDTADRGGYNSAMLELIQRRCPKTQVYSHIALKDMNLLRKIKTMGLSLGVLAWWPYLIDDSIISLAKRGFINTHPSYLPYNRGKHPYFWSIVDGTKFGVTLHYVDENIDSGDVIAQKEIPVTWRDTGESLYMKSREEILNLFYECFPQIKEGSIPGTTQSEEIGSFHYGKELEPFCEIKLDEQYEAKKLLNILRGRMFRGKGEAYFIDDAKKYRVSITIEEME